MHHFYGTKERLFAAAMRLPVVPSEMLALVLGAERERLGGEFEGHLGEVLIGAATSPATLAPAAQAPGPPARASARRCLPPRLSRSASVCRAAVSDRL